MFFHTELENADRLAWFMAWLFLKQEEHDGLIDAVECKGPALF
jgi:hypothetical protein